MRDRQLHEQRQIAKWFGVPSHLVGLPAPWWRRWWEAITRRPNR